MRPKVSVVIPAHNEEGRVGETVKTARKIHPSTEVIVVDDGSTDRTREEALKAGADKVVSLRPSRGKGRALEAGIREARGNFVLLLDADLGKSALEGRKLLEPLLRNEVDLVIARFPGRRRWGVVRTVAALGMTLLGGYRPKEPLSGQRAAKKDTFLSLLPFAKGYGVETAMTVDAARMGLRILEVPTQMRHLPPSRKGLRSSLHKLRQLRDIAIALLERIWRWRHK